MCVCARVCVDLLRKPYPHRSLARFTVRLMKTYACQILRQVLWQPTRTRSSCAPQRKKCCFFNVCYMQHTSETHRETRIFPFGSEMIIVVVGVVRRCCSLFLTFCIFFGAKDEIKWNEISAQRNYVANGEIVVAIMWVYVSECHCFLHVAIVIAHIRVTQRLTMVVVAAHKIW